ncbi:hypothetical protein [Noviherbaspirillum humi]|uniref:hypothetical protein n=1 Tax=Noviherbaspirillum humi TaxID=1688639 RepID=UPI001160C8F0|nr:hypothetical protein [Noviherbaspirillum humi]
MKPRRIAGAACRCAAYLLPDPPSAPFSAHLQQSGSAKAILLSASINRLKQDFAASDHFPRMTRSRTALPAFPLVPEDEAFHKPRTNRGLE